MMTKKITLIIALTYGVHCLSYAQSAPVLDPIENQTISSGSILYFKTTALDEDEDDLTFSIVDALPGMDLFAIYWRAYRRHT